MSWEKRSQVLTSLVTALLSTTAPLSRAMADSVGSVSAVNQAASGILPSGGARLLSLGQDVIFKETIKTTGAGSAQVAFLDRSTLNVGQNSSVVIDEFIFNPAAGTGTMGPGGTGTRGSAEAVAPENRANPITLAAKPPAITRQGAAI